MIIKKITTGFVVQSFDTETKKFVGQEFVVGDECVYEDEHGNEMDSEVLNDENGDELCLFRGVEFDKMILS